MTNDLITNHSLRTDSMILTLACLTQMDTTYLRSRTRQKLPYAAFIGVTMSQTTHFANAPNKIFHAGLTVATTGAKRWLFCNLLQLAMLLD